MNPVARRGKKILIGLILLWGLLALAIRLSTPLLENAREPIARWLSGQLGQPVSFQRIQASWWGIGPRLLLSQVRLGPEPDAIALRSVSIDLSHVSLLKGQLLDALRLTLDGMQLNLVREKNHQIHLVGIPSVKGEGAGPLPLPRHVRLRHTRLHWEDRLRNAAPVDIDELDVDLVRHDRDLDLRGRLDSELGNARFSAHVRGFLGSEDWRGSSYLKVQGLDLGQLLAAYLPQQYRLQRGRLDAELWQQWEHARETGTRGHFRLAQLDLARQAQPPRELAIASLSGNVDYQRREDGEWRIALNDVALQMTPQDLPQGSELALRYRPGGARAGSGADRFDLAATALPLPLLHALAGVSPGTGDWIAVLDGLQPNGQLRDLRLRFSGDDPADWGLDTRVERLSLRPWESVPGVLNLNARLTATPQRADLQLDGRGVALDYRQLFREPLQLRQLGGSLHWQHADRSWLLFSDNLELTTPDLDAQLWLELRHAAGGTPHLDLRGRISNGKVSAAPRYLPAAIMSHELVAWLDQAFSGGRLERADIVVSGPLHDFPYQRTRNGVFEVVGVTRATPLHYQAGWPPLQDVSARLFFHENSLDIDLLAGRIFDSKIVSAHASIASLAPTSPLRMQGRLQGPLADEVRLLQEPALAKDFGHIARLLRTSGDAELSLDFQVPLVHGRGEYLLDGKLRFDNNRMSLAEWNLTIDKIRGELGIGLDTLRAKQIRGIAFGSPISVDVQPVQGATLVSAHAQWPVEALRRRFPELPLQLASGAAEFDVDLNIPGVSAPKGTNTTIEVASDLKGITLDLPAPLAKAADEIRELRIEMPLEGDDAPLHIRYGPQLDARFSADGSRGELRYARGESRLPENPGYRVLARLPQLDLQAWQSLAGRLGPGRDQRPWHLELTTPDLLAGDLRLEDVELSADGKGATVDASIRSPRIAGTMHYRDKGRGMLSAELEHLHLNLDTQETAAEKLPDPKAGPDPRSLPQIALQCGDLQINKAKLGKLQLNLEPLDTGSRITRLSVQGPAGTLRASGNWLWQKGAAHTNANGELHLPDLGAVLADLGYPRNMHDAKTDVRFEFDWPGNPVQLVPATLHGWADLKISDGRLSDVDPGISRVLGLLSLDALKRRLKFNFGDLLKKGYSFDSIKGHFELAGGQAETHDLVVDGPSGRIEIGGRIGLVAHDFDQVVQVTPKLDATLIIASTLAGGPVAGAATFLAQRLLSDEVDKLNRFEYSVTGSWDDPKLIPLKSGGPVSQLINKLSGEKTEDKTPAQENAIDETKTRPKKGLLERLLGKPAPADDTPPAEGTLPGRD